MEVDDAEDSGSEDDVEDNGSEDDVEDSGSEDETEDVEVIILELSRALRIISVCFI